MSMANSCELLLSIRESSPARCWVSIAEHPGKAERRWLPESPLARIHFGSAVFRKPGLLGAYREAEDTERYTALGLYVLPSSSRSGTMPSKLTLGIEFIKLFTSLPSLPEESIQYRKLLACCNSVQGQ